MYKRYFPLLIILLAIGFAWYMGFFSSLNLDALKENRAYLLSVLEQNYVRTVLIFIAVYIAVAALSIPGAVWVSITGGFLFGPFLGTLYSVTGATIGASILFFVVKTAFGAALRDKAGPWVSKFSLGFTENAFSYMLTLRLIPVIPFVILNVIPSLIGVKFRTFFIATFLGIIPGGFVFSLIGNSLGATLDQGGDPDLSLLWSPQVLAPIAGLIILSLIPVIHKRFSKKPFSV